MFFAEKAFNCRKVRILLPRFRRKAGPQGYDAEVAELVDALDSKSSSGNRVWVRAPPSVRIELYFRSSYPARVAELVDAHVSGACAFGRGGSSPPPGT